MLLNLVRLYIGTQPTIPSNEDYCCDKHNKIGSKKLTPPYWLSSQNRSTAARGRHYKRGDLHARKLCKCRAGKKISALKTDSKRWREFQFYCNYRGSAPIFILLYFFLRKGRSQRACVCAFYIRVEALYTLKHLPAESVTTDFFIAGPILDKWLCTNCVTQLSQAIIHCTHVNHLLLHDQTRTMYFE